MSKPEAHYYADSDSLTLYWSDRPAKEAAEAAPGIVVSFGEEDEVVGIEVEGGAQKLFSELLASSLRPLQFAVRGANGREVLVTLSDALASEDLGQQILVAALVAIHGLEGAESGVKRRVGEDLKRLLEELSAA